MAYKPSKTKNGDNRTHMKQLLRGIPHEGELEFIKGRHGRKEHFEPVNCQIQLTKAYRQRISQSIS